MEDKQIIELFWKHSDDAIKEIERKYGPDCIYIAKHILSNDEAAELCLKESLALLKNTIPPHRPQNLKAYIYKVTRNQALQMKYPDFMEADAALLPVELVIYDFLKSLTVEKRRLFVAHYWYFISVSEIAKLYKMHESTVETTLDSLHQKLDDELKKQNISLQEEEFLYAMTEIEDGYLEEFLLSVKENWKINTGNRKETKNKRAGVWGKYQIPILAGILFLVFIGFLWPKDSKEEEPGEQLLQVFGGNIMLEEDFDLLAEKQPWKEENVITALPIYQNLSYTGALGAPVYLDEKTLMAMAEDIASKLETKILEFSYRATGDEAERRVYEIVAMTENGTIEVNGRGDVYVNFTDGVELPPKYEFLDSTSKEEADKTVEHLINYYRYVFSMEELEPDCYATYDLEGNREMNYRATGYDDRGAEHIVEYYFNQVHFYFDEEKGLTGFRYRNYRTATELVSYYPVISLEEAKNLLKEGKYTSDFTIKFNGDNEANIRRVELMYHTGNSREYYQPYYCFYLFMEETGEYASFYVPAVQGATVSEIPPEPEPKIICIDGYELLASSMFYKDGKYFTVENSELIEIDKNQAIIKNTIGETWVEHTANGSLTFFEYGDSEVLLLDNVMSGKTYHTLDAMYIDGKILIIAMEAVGGDYTSQMTSCYVYSQENGSLTQMIEPTPSEGNASVLHGLTFYGGRYATKSDTKGEITIVDALEGTSISTGIPFEDVESIRNDENDTYFIIHYKTGEIAIVEKNSGVMIKKTRFKANFSIASASYKDEKLYVQSRSDGVFVFVISEFE